MHNSIPFETLRRMHHESKQEAKQQVEPKRFPQKETKT